MLYFYDLADTPTRRTKGATNELPGASDTNRAYMLEVPWLLAFDLLFLGISADMDIVEGEMEAYWRLRWMAGRG